MQLVVDSSVIVKWLVADKEDWMEQALKLLERVKSETVEVAAPVLAKYEVVNVVKHKILTDPEKTLCIENLYDLPIKYFDVSRKQARQGREIAEKMSITFYDAVFMELAQRLDATLITVNPKHHKSFPGVKVVDLKDY